MEGDDILSDSAVAEAASGAAAIVHLAAIPDDRRRGGDSHLMDVNLMGTFNVLLAAEAAGVRRVVNVSSGKSIGMLERDPEYLPLDDAHPGLPSGTYGLAKWLGEEMSEAFTVRTGIATICLRPVMVLAEGEAPHPAPKDGPWPLGAWVDTRDFASSVAAALTCPDPGHVRLLIAAEDTCEDEPTSTLVQRHLPHVEWRDTGGYEGESRKGLICIDAARDALGWNPKYTWSERKAP